MVDAPDEPSNYALALSERIQSGVAFDLTQPEIDRLTPYERRVLQRTAERCGYRLWFNLDTGVVSLAGQP